MEDGCQKGSKLRGGITLMCRRKKILLIGEQVFIDRHIGMFEALSKKYELIEIKKNNKFRRTIDKLTDKFYQFFKNFEIKKSRYSLFIRDSQTISEQIKKVGCEYEAIIQIFCSFSSNYNQDQIKPYFLLLDFTMNQAIEQWPEWANFKSEYDKKRFLQIEKETYDRASHIFTMSARTKADLEVNYRIPTHMISVIGSGVSTEQVSSEKNNQIIHLIHDGSDYYRKGTDRSIQVVEELEKLGFRSVLNVLAHAGSNTQNVKYLDFINDRAKLRNLMAKSDFALAPARCDPFPTFVLEALSVGTPVIVSQESGASEFVERICPELEFDWNDIKSVAEYIAGMMQDNVKYLNLRGKCSEFIENNFSNEVIGKRIVLKICELLS